MGNVIRYFSLLPNICVFCNKVIIAVDVTNLHSTELQTCWVLT